ncbi:Retinoblastoma-related protein [Apostasia shenzhenica]|uniref:Retinoblastoma-related protein n=1 Tax=Apostasia shenzhenica TaxID=1088818 RepID=A0A2H9ZWD9_9ASPA|nr:Retinoblastoma-related protein [Apostasia shenzhenica]
MSLGAVGKDDEGAKHSAALQSEDDCAMDARFADLCKVFGLPRSFLLDLCLPPMVSSVGSDTNECLFVQSVLGLDEGMTEEAVALFRGSKQIVLGIVSSVGCGLPMDIERYWFAFLLYCLTRLCSGKEKQDDKRREFKLCQILTAANLNVVDFFKEVPHFCLKADHVLSSHYGSDWEKRVEVSRKFELLTSYLILPHPDPDGNHQFFSTFSDDQLKELQANFEHLCYLSRFYKKAYCELFKPSDKCGSKLGLPSNHKDYVSDYHYFGWLLFLALRVHALNRFQDLVTCTNALVSILAILILHVPTRLRKFAILDSPLFSKKSGKGVELLASLSRTYDASEEELKGMMEKVNNLIVDILGKEPCHASDCKCESLRHINRDDLTYFEDLLEEKSLQSSLHVLNKDYDEEIKTKADIDERTFLVVDDSLMANGSFHLSVCAMNMSHGRESLDTVMSPTKLITSHGASHPPASPVNGNFAGNSKIIHSTPVSTTMTTAKWLREVIFPFPTCPSSVLQQFLASCDIDLTCSVTHRANIITTAIFPSQYGEVCIPGSLQGANLMDSAWAEQRKSESLKLYYKVLEAICRAESQKLSDKNLTSLLSNERFHRCMLACSAELVLATHKTVTMMFPAVLERTGITAFDLSKVIESFVRHEETLPRELKRHLNSLEERLLESMSWEKGSSLYNALIIARPDLSSEINRLGLLAEPMPSLDAIVFHNSISTGGIHPLTSQTAGAFPDKILDARSPKRLKTENGGVLAEHRLFTSPMGEKLMSFNSPRSMLPSLQSAFASPACRNPSTGGETCAEAGINIFFNKILKLAAIRIKSLCERLGLHQQFVELVYLLFQQILRHRTALFFSRHIDQLILCSIYGVNKISSLNLTFKGIIYHYRRQPQCRTQVFRSVYKKGHEYVDIITFYNVIFIPTVKPLLVELGSKVEKSNNLAQDKNDSNGQIPGSPPLSSFPSLPDMSPKKVSASHNVYVSPLRQSKMDALLAPSSKSYYACIGESTHAFQSPSKDLMVINNRLNCGSGRRVGARLNFDMVSDSIVAGSLGHQNGSSGSSAAGTTIDVHVKSELPDS